MRDFLSVVIPAYNEERRIADTLKRVSTYLVESIGQYEIIVVDDGSTDNTASVVKALSRELGKITLIHYPLNTGKGHAVRTGVLASRGNLLLTCDADLSTPIEEYEKLERFIGDEVDVAIGSRGLRDSDIVVRQPWYRERMGKMFNVIVRVLVIGGIKDTQCGFKLFKGDIARSLFKRSMITGFAFDAEVLFLARKNGYQVKEIPIRWLNSPNSKVKIIRDPFKMILELFQIRISWLFGKYVLKNHL